MKVSENLKSAHKNIPRRLDFRRLNRITGMLMEILDTYDFSESEVTRQWHYMHIMSCSQLIKPEAGKRDISMELAAITAALHDYGLIVTGKKENHAEKGAGMLRDFINSYNRRYGDKRGIITDEEFEIIRHAVLHHSEKEIDSGEPYTELLKDIDCLDRYLHGVYTEGEYLERVKKLLS